MSLEPVVNSQDAMAESLSKMTLAKFSEHSLKKAAWAAIEWISHCSVVVIILLGMRGVEALSHWLWPDKTLSFLGLITLDELFSTADFTLLSLILGLGIACVVKAYRGVQ